ncbi:Hsp20/alpha crystallin family protein [Streptomyces sp. NPDC001185]|uniref:Hsp20/alpha crystallin family protein n=1 Tax=Streptomyces sp. NPDC001185 TaxID=3154380 RepID=UPI00332D0647
MSERTDTTRSGPVRAAWSTGHDPVAELEHLWGEVSRLLERSVPAPGSSRHWMPLTEEEDAGDAYQVRAELPGVARACVSVEIDGRELHIQGTLDESTRGHALRRRAGSFSYGIRIPGDVDVEAVRADLCDGVLTVRLPKTGVSTRRTIALGSDRPSDRVPDRLSD